MELADLPAIRMPGIAFPLGLVVGAVSASIDPPVVFNVPEVLIVTPVPEITDWAPDEMLPFT